MTEDLVMTRGLATTDRLSGVDTSATVQSAFEADRIQRAAWAFTTRRVPSDVAYRISRGAMTPQAGDLLLARVDALGHHRGLQLWGGRKKHLFPGDEIVVAYGNRYAAAQFEAVVPKTLGPCQLVAGGGVAAKARSWHSRISRGPTLITPIGLLLRPDGERVNLRDHAIEAIQNLGAPLPPTIAVVGTTMDAGKTTSAAFLVRGLTQAGLRVGYAKVTGTGAGGDTSLMEDAGADPVLDFTDAGFASTYRVPLSEIEGALRTLMAHVTHAGVDACVLEIADGLLQPETAALLKSPVFRSIAGGVLFTARDSMGAVAGVRWLNEHALPVAGLAGVMTASPLDCAEAKAATGMRTFSREELAQSDIARGVLTWVEDQGVKQNGNVGHSYRAHGAREPSAA